MKVKTTILLAVVGIAVTSHLFATDYAEYELKKDKIQMARVVDAPYGKYAVGIELTTSERELFRQITAENVGNRLAITYRGKVLIKPIVREEITSGIIVVGDYETKEESEELVHTILSE